MQPKIADGTLKIANSSEAEALKDKAELTREEMSRIIGQITTNWDPNEAKNKAQTHLTAASDDLKGDVLILGPNDAHGAADRGRVRGRFRGHELHRTGQDAEKAPIEYILDGKQSMTVFKDVRTLVKDAMNLAVDILEGKTPDHDRLLP